MRPRTTYSEEWLKEKQRVRGGASVVKRGTVAASRVSGHMPQQGRASGTGQPIKLAQAAAPYKSKWEAIYANKLELEKKAGLIKGYAYEMHTFKLAHRQYHRSDFLVWHLDGSVELAQVKGKWHKNIRAGIKGLKWAAQLNPWFTWTIKRWTGTGWDSNYVEV